jgi:hypothetical protein
MENLPKEQTKPEQNKPKGGTKKAFGLLAFEAGIEFAFLIAAPLLAGIFAGKWLDNKYHHNFFIILGIFAGLAITCFAVYKRIGDYKNMLK